MCIMLFGRHLTVVYCRAAVRTATELLAMEAITGAMVETADSVPLNVCWEIVRRVMCKSVVGSKSYLAPDEDGEV